MTGSCCYRLLHSFNSISSTTTCRSLRTSSRSQASPAMPSAHDQRRCARGLLPLLAWLCGIAVALSLRYGYYGGHQLRLGPNSSRLMKISSLFVEQLHVAPGQQAVLLYGFDERPQLGEETNWTSSSYLFVDSFNRQGFSMWLNRGSRIWVDWQVAYGSESYGDMLVVLIKGEENLEELERYRTSIRNDLGQSRNGSRAEHLIPEDNMYYLGVINLTPRSLVMNMSIRVASKMYDTSKATSICSTANGECKLQVPFPRTQYYVLETSNSEVPLKVWSIQLTFIARLTAYVIVTGLLVVIISIVLKQIGACDSEQVVVQEPPAAETLQTETQPLLQSKEVACSYGSTEEGEEESMARSSCEDLYEGKICVICYDQRRNCFFTPCGHFVTCYSCAQRILEGANKVCPICRRIIHKARKLMPSP